MIAPGIAAAAELEFGDGEEEQQHAEQLQEERKRLLNSAAPGDGGCFAWLDPEAKSGDDLFAAVTIEEIEGDGECAHYAEEGGELADGEVEELHG